MIDVPAVTYKLAKVLHIEGESPFGCDNCGYNPLKNVYFLEGSDGSRITVGSECVFTLLFGADLAVAQQHDKNIKRAGREWRKAYPPPNSNETRENYINRRLIEIPNMAMARRALMGIQNPYLAAKARLAMQGIEDPNNYREYGRNRHYKDIEMSHADWNVVAPHEGHKYNCWLCHQQETLARLYQTVVRTEIVRHHREIAVQYGANPYDLAPAAFFAVEAQACA